MSAVGRNLGSAAGRSPAIFPGGVGRRSEPTGIPLPGLSFIVRGFGTLLRTTFSFEAMFALFLYSNNLKILLPTFPIDETLVFFIVSIPVFLLIVWRHGLPRHGLVVVMVALLFFGWVTLGLLWTPSRQLALRNVSYNLVFNLYALAVGCLVLAPRRQRLRRFFLWVTLIGLVVAGYGLWIWATQRSFRFYGHFAELRIYLAWGYPAATAAAILLGTSLAMPFLTIRQFVVLLLVGMLGFFLLISTGRGPLLALLASTLVPLLVFRPVVGLHRIAIPRIQLLVLCLLFAAASYVIYLVASEQLHNNTLGRLISLYHNIEEGGVSDRFSRLNYWYTSLFHWSNMPWFGHGPGSFSTLYVGHEEFGTHPHNIILEILVDYGLIGFVLFVVVLLTANARFSAQRLREDTDYLRIWMVFAGILVGAMVSVDLAAQAPLFVAIGLLTLPGGDAKSPVEQRRQVG